MSPTSSNVIRAYPGDYGIVLAATAGAADTTVQAGSFSMQYTTFYPRSDGYRDTVAIRGSRGEKASIGISIYRSDGVRIRTLAVAAGTGAYSVAWNGKSNAGNAQAAGKYKVVQRVTDLWGNTLSDTRYVNLSRKLLHKYTYSKTIHGEDYVAAGKSGTGGISRANAIYADGVKLGVRDERGRGGRLPLLGPVGVGLPVDQVQGARQGADAAGEHRPAGLDGMQRVQRLVRRSVGLRADQLRLGVAQRIGQSQHLVASQVRGYVEVASYAGSSVKLNVNDVRLVVVYGILR